MNGFHTMRAAREDDLFFVQALEMDPANIFVHSWSEATHLANLHDPSYHYFIAENAEATSFGYAILRNDGPGRVEWKRIIVARRGDGIGSAFMKAVLDHFFTQHDTNTIWLDVYEKNDRARHVYEKLGFVEIGEDLIKVPGERLLIMECLRPLPA